MRFALAALLWISFCLRAGAFSLSLQYVNPSDTFFTPTVKATLLQAANDLSFAVTTSLSALSQDVYTGSNSGTNATVDWSLSYTNPETGSSTTLNSFNLAANEIRIFVGTRDLTGSTLGQGGPGGAGFSLSGSGSESRWVGAVASAESASNAGMVRGGPALSTLSSSSTLGSTTANYTLGYGYAIGSVTFDNLVTWHTDYASSPSAGENDFYSVALHELTHAVGFGTGSTWDAQVSGTNWLGSRVTALLGSGTNVLDPGQAHIASGLSGHPLINGSFNFSLTQEAAMDPTLTVGTRKYLTDLDLAFLSDMGWATVPEPSPLALAVLLALPLALMGLRRGMRG